MAHRNANDNADPHHLYEIIDKVDNDVFKYGISSDPIDKDGLSKRIRVQVKLANLLDGWARFFGRIILTDIPDRRDAKRMEKEYIRLYKEKNGRRPRGNLTE